MILTFLTLCIGAYLLGNVPFGLLLCRLFGYGDIRNIGSGNIGATNVLRTGNKLLALLTLVLDIGKGALAVYLASFYMVEPWTLWAVGLMAIIGHNYPICLNFRGGKGVATTIGTLFMLNAWIGVCVCMVWLLTAAISRTSSLSALTAFLVLPALTLLFAGFSPLLVAVLISLLIFWRHLSNIERLLNGTESKISFLKRDKV